jgi:hypothetical protein
MPAEVTTELPVPSDADAAWTAESPSPSALTEDVDIEMKFHRKITDNIPTTSRFAYNFVCFMALLLFVKISYHVISHRTVIFISAF